jgi:hypothetical protein
VRQLVPAEDPVTTVERVQDLAQPSIDEYNEDRSKRPKHDPQDFSARQGLV